MYLRTALSLLTALSISLISCNNNEDAKEKEKEKRQETIPAYSDPSDSLYIAEATFYAGRMSFPVEQTSKYKLPDSANLITSTVAYWIPDYKVAFYSLLANKGIKYKLSLDNHTYVLLNSDSKLKFRPSVGKYLELTTGEAYFDIKENSTLIKVDNKIDLLADSGTRINITAYNDRKKDGTISVTLLSGKARLTFEKLKKNLSKTGRKTIINLGNNHLTEEKFEISDVLAWTINTFDYNDIDYYTLLKRICRWYDLELVCPLLPDEYVVFGGNFKESAQQIISRINSFSSLITCRLEGKKLVVSKK